MNRPHLIGTWKLLEYKICFDDPKEEIYPFGENALGYLIYTESHVSVQMMQSKSPKQSSEKREKNYIGYVGSYEILPEVIIHHPEVSLHSNFILSPQKRHYQCEGDELILSCPYEGENKQGRFVVIWKRLTKNSSNS